MRTNKAASLVVLLVFALAVGAKTQMVFGSSSFGGETGGIGGGCGTDFTSKSIPNVQALSWSDFIGSPDGLAGGSAAMSFVWTSSPGRQLKLDMTATGAEGCGANAAYSANLFVDPGTQVTLAATTQNAHVRILPLQNQANVVQDVCPIPQCDHESLTQTVTLSGTYRLEAVEAPGWDETASVHLVLSLGNTAPLVSIGDAVDSEGDSGSKFFAFPVILSAPLSTSASVSFGTQDLTATVADNDYNAAFGSVSFAPGEVSKVISIAVIGDTKNEANETFRVILGDPSANILIGSSAAMGTIINDDVAVDFDWTVPDRFGLDQNGDQIIDYYPPDGHLVISPDGWRVDFTFSVGGSCPSGLSSKWTVNGLAIAPSDPEILLSNAAACKFSYRFPREDTFQVKLELTDSTNAVVGQQQKAVIVQDWLIVSIGDSVASGEGNPDAPGPIWEDRQCHRTSAAGPAQAAMKIERADPKTSVTFIHLACSGASINEGLLRRYVGQEPGRPLLPQVQAMDLLVGNREVDAVLISIGANDVEFSNIVKNCFLRTDCNDASKPNSMAAFFDSKLPTLPAAYDALGLKLRSGLRHPLKPGRTYITEYFDPTRDESGAFCDNKILEEAFDFPRLGITATEGQWASTEMLVRLNQTVAAAASRNDWHFVNGIYDAFRTHGYCAIDSQRWIVQATESLRNQHNKDGTIHPNRPGHVEYGARLTAALTADFYAGDDFSRPRAPITGP